MSSTSRFLLGKRGRWPVGYLDEGVLDQKTLRTGLYKKNKTYIWCRTFRRKRRFFFFIFYFCAISSILSSGINVSFFFPGRRSKFCAVKPVGPNYERRYHPPLPTVGKKGLSLSVRDADFTEIVNTKTSAPLRSRICNVHLRR